MSLYMGLLSRAGVETDGKGLEATKARPARALRARQDLVAWISRQQGRQRDASLQARQVHPSALVGAAAERHMPVGFARDVEDLRPIEGVRVAVGGSDAQGDLATGGDGDP